ncbi:SDR family NAD(P)-dependent oxidoreductase [Futiania mangrovi]|uniref:SDR family oxidoreductase n=1 Tax=Futiania mangrovi TaxID=2959716 RepID=A0A9J6PAL0_9PROT|nr:SDR family NAD(P)-dependent oxidoreductase [Futiania mangrovii]MCP1335465.1 SDR family oxidoreductase [Futiania mangrovii]
MRLKDKVAVVTGGASGLGEAVVRDFAAQGARVAIFDLNADRGAGIVADLGSDRVSFHAVDVTDEASVTRALDEVVAAHGAVHVCVNCAGVADPGKILDRDGNANPLSSFERVVRINLIGTYNVMSQCAARMALNPPEDGEERGVIVNTSSGAAYEGQIGQPAYASSKNGVIGLNLPSARELGRHGIRVNAIAPGLFLTPMAASLGEKVIAALTDRIESPKRLGRPEEFAHCCRFLVENAYINGETIRLDAATRLTAK